MIPDAVLGPLAGVTTSAFWALTSILFTSAGLRLGATRVNALRLGLAVIMLGTVYVASTGTLFPTLPRAQLVDLAVSGVVGLTLCDQALFLAFVLIGPRRVVLVETTTAPLFGLVLGATLLDELPGRLALLGVTITLAGVAWVIRERPAASEKPDVPRAVLVRGLVLAFGAAALQATGAFLAKRGMGHGPLGGEHVDPLHATYVRMIFGTLGMLPLLAIHSLRRRKPVVLPGETARGVVLTLAATVFGPVLGVWLSLVAFDLTPLGVALTLLALSPVFVLPLARRLYGERVSLRAVLGAVLAVAGTAILAFGR
ncbi:MAG: DMT family transporter [Planctomycetes bacterium]|nr:DMT family transporter [Planctomycetota bacterium]